MRTLIAKMEVPSLGTLPVAGIKKGIYTVLSLLLMVSLSVMPARAYDWSGVVCHVTNISPVGFASNVQFNVDNAPSTCPGSYMFYIPANADNAKGVLAVILAAQLTGKSITIYGINPTSSFGYCQVQWIVLNNS